MLCCLFYCNLAFQRDPKSFKRVIAFWVSSSKKEWRLHTGFWTDSRSKRKKNTRSKPAEPIPLQNHSTGLSATFQLNSKPNSSPQHTLQSSAESKKASHPGRETMLLGPTVDTSRARADCRANKLTLIRGKERTVQGKPTERFFSLQAADGALLLNFKTRSTWITRCNLKFFTTNITYHFSYLKFEDILRSTTS